MKEVALQAAQLLTRHDVSAALAAAAASETALLQPQQPADDAISVGAFSKALAGLRAGLTMEHIRALAQIAHKTATEKSAGRAGSSELSRAAVTDAINSLLSGDQQAASPALLFSPKKKSFADEKPSEAFESTAALVSPSMQEARTRPVSAPLRATSLKNETGSVLEPPSFIKGTLDEIKKSLYGKHVDLRSVAFRAIFFRG